MRRQVDNDPLPEGRFLGIVGLQLVNPVWDMADALRLQPVEPRLGAHEIARALTDPRKAATLGRYCEYIDYELAVAPTVAVGKDAILFAWSFISLLRVRSLVEILVPAALPCSWSVAVLNRLAAHSCEVDLLEDSPNIRQLEEAEPVKDDDLAWIVNRLTTFNSLKATSPPYALAVDSLCEHNHQSSFRMAAAMLWSGIEALFDIKSEISYRLAIYIATLLEKPGNARYELFKRVKKEYNTRSRIMHGDSTDPETLRLHVVTTRKLLSRLICRVTENQGVPKPEEIDGLVLTESP